MRLHSSVHHLTDNPAESWSAESVIEPCQVHPKIHRLSLNLPQALLVDRRFRCAGHLVAAAKAGSTAFAARLIGNPLRQKTLPPDCLNRPLELHMLIHQPIHHRRRRELLSSGRMRRRAGLRPRPLPPYDRRPVSPHRRKRPRRDHRRHWPTPRGTAGRGSPSGC